MNIRGFQTRLKKLGFDIELVKSNLSESRYLKLSHPELDLNIRISNHVARPTYQKLYGFADFEIGTHIDADGDYEACLEFCKRKIEDINKPYQPTAADLARRESEIEKENQLKLLASENPWLIELAQQSVQALSDYSLGNMKARRKASRALLNDLRQITNLELDRYLVAKLAKYEKI